MQRNNGMPACASCKHQRKKCTDKCVLAPFFPVNKSREFQAVHKVFGVSNATKIVKNLKEEDRKKAIDSLVWEAFCRLKDPILGPYGEYRKVYEELKLYKSSQYQQILQVPEEGGGMVYKPTSLVGWNNTNTNTNNNAIIQKGTSMVGVANYNNNNTNYIHHNNGNSISNSSPYTYSLNHHNIHGMERIRQERHVGSAVDVVLPQQNSVNSLNQQYYL
ncbi:hypothetical protein TEA_026554 [Camellia sinensis var. sinensis]|uniref:LOB domain-containing protein n=1 Tax=Camellia sinensis var. sinensis TaxID=542762 RepID=A0A4S4DNP2_CAMSN|nr:hypothetical protein TEA_026554 [Camellia sinensis var. sinensis]